MNRKKVTFSLPGEIADYLRSQPNASSTVAEAVSQYRTRELTEELEQAYREDSEEAERLNREWAHVDSELPD